MKARYLFLGAAASLAIWVLLFSAAFAQQVDPNAATDYSQNQTGLGGLNLLATVPAGNSAVASGKQRAGGCTILNQSTNVLTFALDNGTGGGLTIYNLAPALAAGSQGGEFDCTNAPFNGRIRVYGTAGSQVAVRVW